MRRNINKTFYILIMIICCFFFQTTAYSLLGSSFTITGDAIARIRNNVRINDFKIHEVSDGVISSYEEFAKTTTNSNVTLPNSDSYIIYRLDIGNYESVEMQLSSIVGLPSNLTYELIDYTLHDMICDVSNKCTSGAEKTIYIKIMYANYDSANTNYNVNLNYQFSEFSNVLMIGSEFKNTIPSTATHLVFTDEKPVQGTVLTDVSANADMGVVGYLDGTTYKVSTRRTGVMPEANSDSSYMFNGSALTSIDLSNLSSTATVTEISYMFQDCTKLTSIIFGENFNTTKVQNMRSVFKNCTSLLSVDLSNFVTSNVVSFSEMFYGCSSLTSVDVNHFDVSKATSFRQTFRNCSSLVSLDLSNWQIKKNCNFSHFLQDCVNLETFIADNLINSYVTNIEAMFYNNNSLKNLYISNWNTSSIPSIYGIFKANKSLTSLDLSGWDVSNVTNGTWVFEGCENIVSLNLSGWKFTKSLSLVGMFHGMSKLETLNLTNWDTSMVTSTDRTFTNLYSLKTLDLSSWNTSNVTDMSKMFNNCQSLEKIYVGTGWDVSNVVSSSDMFYYCIKLSNYNSEYQDITKAYVGDGGYLTYLVQNVTIDGVVYQFEDQMTWGEWLDSKYNTFGFVSDGVYIIFPDESCMIVRYDPYNYSSYFTDVIDPSKEYYRRITGCIEGCSGGCND